MPRRVSSSAALRADHPRWLFKDAATPLSALNRLLFPHLRWRHGLGRRQRVLNAPTDQLCRSFLARAALAALAGLASQNRLIGLSTRLGSGRCGLQGLPAREKPVGGWHNSAPPRSPNGIYGTAAYSALIPAARIPLPHFSVSSAMSLPKSAGEPASNMPPMSASCVLILGSARPALISLLSLSTTSMGVVLGAPTPNQTL